MDELELEQKEEKITSEYRDFLSEVRKAFDRHCDKIKLAAAKKLEVIPKENEDGRQKVLDEQKAELDKTLAELKQLLAKREAEVRVQLEEIASMRERKEFSFDDELAKVEAPERKHIA
ncbi:hypothetical protein KJ657_02935 [Patescibacteria group bacterium]|nr:hypothetical protein [Patescibacteria group bacterium]MBU1016019.1 hypothetical protein [Patescibacteria group bacterium]MBU1684979.1 hypothetical protein [Patescibacteria group bacterium]MBU1938875.1 hypothetical protein [Patescibacteria group bacterium]